MMICELKLEIGFYWVFFESEWNMLRYDGDDFWWTDGARCYKADNCICVPVKEPDFKP